MHWSRPGSTASEFYEDRFACEQQAASSYPTMLTQIMTNPGVNMPNTQQTQTNCTSYGGQINCTSQPTGLNASIYNRPPSYMTVDANAGNRDRAVQSCLMSKGYSQSR
jgi:hypothetical protein